MVIGLLVCPAEKLSVPLWAVKSPGAVAVPLAVVKLTATASVLASERVTENVALTVPLLPSVTVLSLIESDGVLIAVEPAGSHVPALTSEDDGHVVFFRAILSARILTARFKAAVASS